MPSAPSTFKANSVVALSALLGSGSVEIPVNQKSTRGLRASRPAKVRSGFGECSLYGGWDIHHGSPNVDGYTCDHQKPTGQTRHPPSTSTTTTTTIRDTTTNPPKTCPKCATDNQGKLTCCVKGASWFMKCGNPGRSKEHTWLEGVEACKGTLGLW